MKSQKYTNRFYRRWQNPRDLIAYRVRYFETDLQIYSRKNLSEKASLLVKKYRNQIEKTIRKYPQFLKSLDPVRIPIRYRIIEEMIQKSSLAGVGPMAGVAGAIAEFVGKNLLQFTDELIIENGGDIFIKTLKERTLLVYAGEESPFKDKIRIRIKPGDKPFGICTSSKKIGHSLSFGNTDAVVVIAQSAITADAFATALGNIVKTQDDIEKAVGHAQSCSEISGGLILIGDKIAAFGEIEFL